MKYKTKQLVESYIQDEMQIPYDQINLDIIMVQNGVYDVFFTYFGQEYRLEIDEDSIKQKKG